MAYNGFAIDTYLDAAAVTRQLDQLIQKPVYSIRRDKLADYVQNYFEGKCPRSKAMIAQAKSVIPGGVQHNLAFNYPFPIVVTKAEGAKLYDIDGNWYYDLLQAGGPTILGSNMPAVREQVIDLLNTCGPSTGLFHEYEYKLAKKISDLVPSVEMFRMLGSGTEADMCAARIARLKTGHKNILKMGGAYHGWSDQLSYGIRIPGTKGILSKGVPGYVFKHTDEFFPNDLEDLERKLRANRLNGGTAAVYIEPMGPESGTRPVSKEFIRGAAKLARDYGALLIFDEVVTGFRIGTLAYLTDFKTIEDAEAEKLRGTEVLAVNALRFAPHPSHFNLAEALALIRRVGPREAYITHMSHEIGLHAETEATLPPGVHLAYDGLEVEI